VGSVLILLNTITGRASRGGGLLVKVLGVRAVQLFLEDGLRLDMLELGLEIFQTRAVVAGVAATAGIGQVVCVVLDFVTLAAPVETIEGQCVLVLACRALMVQGGADVVSDGMTSGVH
jgi:hypothetical protein